MLAIKSLTGVMKRYEHISQIHDLTKGVVLAVLHFIKL